MIINNINYTYLYLVFWNSGRPRIYFITKWKKQFRTTELYKVKYFDCWFYQIIEINRLPVHENGMDDKRVTIKQSWKKTNGLSNIIIETPLKFMGFQCRMKISWRWSRSFAMLLLLLLFFSGVLVYACYPSCTDLSTVSSGA